jgi:hypothetical protein
MALRRDSTSSSGSEDLPDFRSTAEGAAAQAEIALLDQRIPPESYLDFLKQFAGSHRALRDRPTPRGKRFTLL